MLVIRETGAPAPSNVPEYMILERPDVTNAEPEQFVARLESWLQQAAERYKPALRDEPMRLLEAGEYRAAVIAAISLLEASLRERLDIPRPPVSDGKAFTLRAILEEASRQRLLGDVSVQTALGWLRVRNAIVHDASSISKIAAERIVLPVLQVMDET